MKPMTELEQITQNFKAQKKALKKKIDLVTSDIIQKSYQGKLKADDLVQLFNNKESFSIYSIEVELCSKTTIKFNITFQDNSHFPLCVEYNKVQLNFVSDAN